MELKEEHVGKPAKVIEEHEGLLKDSTVIIRKKYDSWYVCKVIDGKWRGADHSHNCGGIFMGPIGYNIFAKRLELIEEEIEEKEIEEEKEEETISIDLDNPFGGMEKFK